MASSDEIEANAHPRNKPYSRVQKVCTPPLAMYTWFQRNNINSTHLGYPEATALAKGAMQTFCTHCSLHALSTSQHPTDFLHISVPGFNSSSIWLRTSSIWNMWAPKIAHCVVGSFHGALHEALTPGSPIFAPVSPCSCHLLITYPC